MSVGKSGYAQPQDTPTSSRPTTDAIEVKDKGQMTELIKLMVTGEEKVVTDFNRIFATIFPNVEAHASSPFKTTVHITDNRYYLDTIQCFNMMLERLKALESSGMFELNYQKF